MKKIIFISDPHTGHVSGLTPPDYQAGSREQVREQNKKWEWFCEKLLEKGPFDAMISMGDIVDGQGVKDSSETILDPNKQISAAIDIVNLIEAPVNWFVFGTRVHTTTGDGLELDYEVARAINGSDDPKIKGQIWLQIDDYVLDCRHAPAGRSGVPHTKGNPLMRERMSNEQWYLEGRQVLANHYFRGHCHYQYNVGVPNKWSAYAVPALQSPDTKHGRVLSQVVHCGFGILTIEEGEWPKWEIINEPIGEPKAFSLFNQ
jgi:hypothetical protein